MSTRTLLFPLWVKIPLRYYFFIFVLILLDIPSASGSAVLNHQIIASFQRQQQRAFQRMTSFLTKRAAARRSTSSFAGTEAAQAPQEHLECYPQSPESYDEPQEQQMTQEALITPQGRTVSITPHPAAAAAAAAAAHQQQHRDPGYMWSSLVAGIGSGALSSVMCAPLDLVRTRLQVLGDLKGVPSRTLRQTFVDIFKKEGWTGYFRGLGASLLTVPAFWGCYFPLYDECKRRWSAHSPSTNPSVVHCGSAVMAGAVSDLICNPMFVVRTRLQTEALHHIADGTKQRGPPGIVRTIRALYLEGGALIFWRGMSANLMGLSHVAVQFPVYEWLKKELVKQRLQLQALKHDNHHQHQHPEPTALDLFLASGLSKMTASLLTYPHEVVRSRMMDARGSAGVSLLATTSRVYAQDGILGFYSGLPVALIRVIPNCCITFMTYELLLRLAKDEIRKRRKIEGKM